MLTISLGKLFIMMLVLSTIECGLKDVNLPEECYTDEAPSEEGTRTHKQAEWFRKINDWKKIGEGGFGKVYKGTIDDLKDPIAVKVVELNENNVAEVDFLIKFRNKPGFAKFYRCEATDDNLYIFQQSLYDITGNNMKSAYETLHKKELLTRLKIYKELSLAIASIHEEEYVHNDIKPENIMADCEDINHLYPIDFGMVTKKGVKFLDGTIEFKAPEYFSESFTVDEPDDIWALALSIAEIEMSPFQLGSYEFGAEWTSESPDINECLNFLYGNIKQCFEVTFQEKLDSQCGPDARNAFENLILGGLHPYRAERFTTKGFINQLNETINLCEIFNRPPTEHQIVNPSKKETVASTSIPLTEEIEQEITQSISTETTNPKDNIQKIGLIKNLELITVTTRKRIAVKNREFKRPSTLDKKVSGLSKQGRLRGLLDGPKIQGIDEENIEEPLGIFGKAIFNAQKSGLPVINPGRLNFAAATNPLKLNKARSEESHVIKNISLNKSNKLRLSAPKLEIKKLELSDKKAIQAMNQLKHQKDLIRDQNNGANLRAGKNVPEISDNQKGLAAGPLRQKLII